MSLVNAPRRLLSIALLACLSANSLSAIAEPAERAPHKPSLTKPPALVEFVEAPYPESEKAAGKAAAVVLEVAIGADGAVSAARVVESASPAFDAAALEAVRRFRFTPAEIDGVPAPIRIRYRYEFVLQEAPPTQASFSGVVREQRTSAPLAGVVVTVEGVAPVVTDENGRFELEHVPPGAHQIVLSRPDLRSLTTEEAFEAGRKLEAIYQVELNPPTDSPTTDSADAEDDVEIVVVVPKLTKQVVSTQVKAEDAQRVAGTQGDVLKIVENLPGVTRASAGSGQLVVWGAAPEDTRVFVDGVELPALYHYGGVRSLVHGDLVRSVELLPGGYGPSYGRGTGGLVRVDTRDMPEDRWHGSAQLDLLDASAAAQGPLGRSFSASVSVRKSHLAFVLDRISHEDTGELFPLPRYADAQARLRYRHDARTYVEVGGLVSWDEVTRTVSSQDPSERKSQARSLDFQRVFLRYVREPGDGTRVTVTPWVGFDQRALDARFSGTPTRVESAANTYGLRATYSGRAERWLTGTLGVDVRVSRVSSNRTGSISSPAREGDAAIFGQAPSDQTNVDAWRVVQGSAAPFGEADFGLLNDTLHVVPGLRVEPQFQSVSRRIPSEGSNPDVGAFRSDTVLEPRLSLRYAPTARATLKAAVGRYHQPALPDDLSSVFGNPLLGSAAATHWLGGAQVKITSRLELETTAFYTRTSGLAARNPLASPLVAEALVQSGEGRAFGAQFLLRHELTRGFFGWIAYTLLRSERKDPDAHDYRLFDYDQTHVLTALASYELGRGFDVGLRARYATGYPRTPVIGAYYDARRAEYTPILGAKNATRVPAFVQIDARIAKRFKLGASELELYADVQNVTDRDNPEEIAYSADYSERRYIVGLPILPVLGARLSY